MAKTKVSEWSTTPSSNTDIDGINIAEGCAPSGINDAIRDMMAQIRSWQSGTYGDTFNGPVNGTVGATTPSTGAFTTLSASSTVTLSGGTANGVAYLNGSKVVTTGSALTFDGTNLATTGDISLGAGKLLKYSSTAYMTPENNVSGAEISTTGVITFKAGVGASEQMRLTSTGLGIGTSSPAYKLSVQGAVEVRSAGAVHLRDASNTNFASLYNNSGAMVFETAYTERMRLDTSGNLGLGVTPSAWASSKAIQIGSSAAPYMGLAQMTTATADGYMLWGAYLTGNRTFAYTTTGDAVSAYRQSSNTHAWFNAPSGTAGNAISFTQAATLTANGDYLVGTTTNSGSSSNTKQVVGGNFRTFQNTATIPALGTATILTLSSSVTGVYIINANFGPQGNAIYGGMLIVVANSGSFRIVTNGSGASSALTLSGANVQITNAINAALDATGSAFFIGN